MIKHLELTNVGPAPSLTLDVSQRLNLLTGDNGLGKSFLLDIAWWALTGTWPSEVNPRLNMGRLALPRNKKADASINFSLDDHSSYRFAFNAQQQHWQPQQKWPDNKGLAIYVMADGNFCVWDSARNDRQQASLSLDFVNQKYYSGPARPQAYAFSAAEVWAGLEKADGAWLCNGLIRDWASWQKEKGSTFQLLKNVLKELSPSADELLEPGKLTRISLDDVRDMPTLRMPYGQDVPLAHASSGIRRIIALAYFLVWCWEEHCKASELLGQAPEPRITLLVDEAESHLHPKWQRRIIPALLEATKQLTANTATQLLIVTHSPLVMASVEPSFDAKQDAWFDLDLVKADVKLTQRDFEKHGDVTNWLTSEAFDLESDRPLEYEQLTKEAAALLEGSEPSKQQIKDMHRQLVEALSPKDDFLFRWRAICDQKGWLE